MQENPFAKNKNYCTFYIVRHGETEWNVNRLIQGQGDSPLTSEGVFQAKELVKELKNTKFDLVFSSDLLRAKRTAEILASEHKLEVKTTKFLRERRFGKLEGQPLHLLETFNKLYKELNEEQRKKHKLVEDAESDEEMISRFITFLRETAITHPRKTILSVTHGGLMRIFLNHIGYWLDRYFNTPHISNTAYIKLLSDGVDFFVEETKGIKKPEDNL